MTPNLSPCIDSLVEFIEERVDAIPNCPAWMRRCVTALCTELWDFQWSITRSENLGEIDVDYRDDSPSLVLSVWAVNNDNPDDGDYALTPLLAVTPIDFPPRLIGNPSDIELQRWARQEIRRIIHMHLCHEADEQLWFGDHERPFHPHQETT